MDQKLSQLLKDHIEDIYPQLQELPMRVSEKTARAFNFDHRQPLDVTFGPDVESYLFHGTRLVSARIPQGGVGAAKVDVRHGSALEFVKNFQSMALAYVRDRQPVGFDGNQIEVRFDPCDPIEAIDSYDNIKAAYDGVAAQMGLRADFGLSQHWHYSINQNCKPLFRYDEVLRPLETVSVYSALAVQRAFSAFFTYPKRLENESYAQDYNVVKLKWHTTDKLSSVFVRNHGKYATVEPRLGVNDAEQSVALYLSSLKYALEHFMEQYEIDEEFNFDDRLLSGAEEIPVGPGAYMEVLDDTVSGGFASGLLPKDVFNALVVDSAQGYIDYLQDDDNVYGRNPDTVQNYIDRCNRIILDHS